MPEIYPEAPILVEIRHLNLQTRDDVNAKIFESV